MTTRLAVTGLSKRYASYTSNLQRFANWFGANINPVSEYWANRDISFEVKAGEALALIGQNGAGKSTLLKAITGTIRPTLGQVVVHGHVSAILELGLGFNPEFTGRQNIYHAGGLMGFSRASLSSLMPAIEEFAEIGEFFDQPTRVYSSGMQARLAFALVTARQPDLLIIDEVLSVGDSYFQHKSFERIRQFKEQGTTIILVTHSLSDVRSLCSRVILLDQGRVLRDGLPDEVVDYYNAMVADRGPAEVSHQIEQSRGEDGWLQTRSGTFEAIVEEISLCSMDDSPLSAVIIGQRVKLVIKVAVRSPVPRLVVGLMLRDRAGHTIWGSNTWHTGQVIHDLSKDEHVLICHSFICTLGPGSYAATVSLSSSATHIDHNYEWRDNGLVFDVVNVNQPSFIGTTWLDGEFHIERAWTKNSVQALSEKSQLIENESGVK